jgi:hypothetical protein
MTTFRQLNHDWNAEPNSPIPQAVVEDGDVILTFWMNAFRFPQFKEEDTGRIRFTNSFRYRIGTVNDEGWYQGQCRFSKLAPKWGEFYEVEGDLRLNECPQDWIMVGSQRNGLRHFLFYFRDEEFECDALDWKLEIVKAK